MNPRRADPPAPYVGITGTLSVHDARLLGELAVQFRGWAPEYRLMAALLVGAGQSRRGWERIDDPSLRAVMEILAATGPPLCVAVHLSPESRTTLANQIEDVCAALPRSSALQVNAVRPDPNVLRMLRRDRPDVEIIIQANRRSLEQLTAAAVVSFASAYYGIASHVLLDFSEGRQIPFDVEWTADCLRTCQPEWRRHRVRAGVAGGLGPDCGSVLGRLRRTAVDRFSIDAEGRLSSALRSSARGLDPVATRGYVRAALEALNSWSATH